MSDQGDYRTLFYDLKAKAEARMQELRALVAKRRGGTRAISTLTYQLYARHRPDVAGKRCLDVALGAGWAMQSILASGAAWCDGVDISNERLEQARALLSGQGFANFKVWLDDAETLAQCPDDHYDYVNYLDIIEHLLDWRAGLRQVRRVLRPGGLAYIKTTNNLTDRKFKMHHGLSVFAARLLPGYIAPPAKDMDLMLKDNMDNLTEEEREAVRQAAPEGFHEHIHQFMPDELKQVVEEEGFEVALMTGTPLGSDTLFAHEDLMPSTAVAFVELVESPLYEKLIEGMREDLVETGGLEGLRRLPAEYALSDNMILVARKL